MPARAPVTNLWQGRPQGKAAFRGPCKQRPATDMAGPPPEGGKWPTGLCGCFEDCGTCCCCYWCHMCQYGSVASDIDPKSSCCGQCCCFWLLHYCCLQGLIAGPKRAQLRAAHNLPPEPCGGWTGQSWAHFAIHAVPESSARGAAQPAPSLAALAAHTAFSGCVAPSSAWRSLAPLSHLPCSPAPGDCCVHTWCGPCAVAQEARIIKARLQMCGTWFRVHQKALHTCRSCMPRPVRDVGCWLLAIRQAGWVCLLSLCTCCKHCRMLTQPSRLAPRRLVQKYGAQPAQAAFVTAPMTAPPPEQAMYSGGQ
jgi:Cys-rich protein (TIGR01571 family)